MDNVTNPIAVIGDNSQGLTQAEQIAENLNDRHSELVARGRELASAIVRVPAVIDSADTADKVSEMVRMCISFQKAWEAVRVKEKEVYLSGGRAVDGFHKSVDDPVNKVRLALLGRRSAWDRKVEDEERARLKAIADAEAKRA